MQHICCKPHQYWSISSYFTRYLLRFC